jgi:hypothetical protein
MNKCVSLNLTINVMKHLISTLSVFVILFGFTSCEPNDPAILKVFVRSSTQDFVDTTFTNSSGFSVVDMDQYFDKYRSGDENTTGYFDIVVKYNNKTAYGKTRCRIHTTSVETIYLPN